MARCMEVIAPIPSHPPRWMKAYLNHICQGCGIKLSDGYSYDCSRCNGRRYSRLRKGTRYTLTGHPYEAIDNETGRIVFYDTESITIQ